MDSLESSYYLVHGCDPLEERLSNMQNYCRYKGNQSGRLAVQDLQKLWELNAKLLAENKMAEPVANEKITRVSYLKIGQLVLVKSHCKGPFNPTYIYDHKVAEILNDSMVLLTTLDGKQNKCNIPHVKPVSSLEVYVGLQAEIPIGTFFQFQVSTKQNPKVTSTSDHQHSYNLRSKHRNDKYIPSHK